MTLAEIKEECLKTLPNKLIEFVQECYSTGNNKIELSKVEEYSVLYLWFGINVKSALLKLAINANPIYKEYMDATGQDSWDKLIESILESEFKSKIFNLAFNDVCTSLFIEMSERIKKD